MAGEWREGDEAKYIADFKMESRVERLNGEKSDLKIRGCSKYACIRIIWVGVWRFNASSSTHGRGSGTGWGEVS